MKGYEITERGKIIIVVLLVLIVLIIPSVFISINALVRETPQEDPPGITETTPQPEDDPVGENADEIANRPWPPGGNDEVPGGSDNENSDSGNTVDIPPEEGNGGPIPPDASDSSDSSDASQGEPPEQGLVGLNVPAGTMAFVYFPGVQNALDAETSAALESFLASPRNVENARVIVQFPQLAEGDRLNVVNAILNELTGHGVPRQDIVFFTIDETVEGDSFEVRLSFQTPQVGGK